MERDSDRDSEANQCDMIHIFDDDKDDDKDENDDALSGIILFYFT
jgi:hypothetical protein